MSERFRQEMGSFPVKARWRWVSEYLKDSWKGNTRNLEWQPSSEANATAMIVGGELTSWILKTGDGDA